jgi:ribonuclease P protein component
LRQTFKKGERLNSKRFIKFLFDNGKSFFVYPFKVFYVEIPEKREFPVEILITVSKKRIKGAVRRNKIKRLIRESYRKNKYVLFEDNVDRKETLLVAFIYVADTVMKYNDLERKIILILQRLKKHHEKDIG